MKNRTWVIVAIVAAIFPYGATIYEVTRQNPLAGVLAIVMSVVLAAVVIAALRVGRSRSPIGEQSEHPSVTQEGRKPAKS